MTETDGWRHVYKVNIMTGQKTLLTPGKFDVASICSVTDKIMYFIASPENATQRFLFKTDLKGSGKSVRITPAGLGGINTYDISPDVKAAIHMHEACLEPLTEDLVRMSDQKTVDVLVSNDRLSKNLASVALPDVKFSKVTTSDGVEMDVRMIYPLGFDPSKKYPVLFYVYGEPWDQVAVDAHLNPLDLYMAQKGYFVIAMDNRGSSSLKGSDWRKSLYKKNGVINSRDQAMAAKELLKEKYFDPGKVAVWGWSGGGSMTLNLMFRYPEIYKTGVAVAAVSSLFLYDNIYEERYMGLPQENSKEYAEGSPVTYARNLKGNLLIIHGSGDDNVHYQNCEVLINELVKYNRQFQLMEYPNRTHGIYEGEGTTIHLYTLLTNFLLEHASLSDN